MNTHDSRLSAAHYALAKKVIDFLRESPKPVTNTVIFAKVGNGESGLHQKRVMRFLRDRKLVTMRGRSRWVTYVLSEAYRRGLIILPLRIGESLVEEAPLVINTPKKLGGHFFF